MNETILKSGRKIGPLVAIYFILYHLFVSLVSFHSVPLLMVECSCLTMFHLC